MEISIFYQERLAESLPARDWDTRLSGIGVSVVMTLLFNIVGWIINTVIGEAAFGLNAEYQKWTKTGGRPYWDSLGGPINTATPIVKQTGLAEPAYTDFVPPAHWCYPCPVCGASVEKQIDVCRNCNYGADGDSTAYHQRWGDGRAIARRASGSILAWCP